MSKIQPEFKPDIHVIIKMNSATGQTQIETGNGLPINPLVLAALCCGIAKVQLDNMITEQAEKLHRQLHPFFSLPGEHRCRVPRCGKIAGDPIHSVPEKPAVVS